ncbi:ABC transporter permease [Enterococcus sp. LJL99]
MIFNLAKKSLKGQFLNYFVYFVSMTFAVVVYYCFNALTYNRTLVRRAGQDIHINGAMSLGGALVIIMILGFMLSANHFFLSKREKEIGIYQLIGMRKSKISFLFFTETLILGACSLFSGLVLGIIFSKLFSMVLAKAMFLQVDSLFSLSIPSMIQTSIIFVLMLLIISARSTFLIYRYHLSKVFDRWDKKNSNENQLTKTSIFLSFLGLFLILLGYLLAYNIIEVIMLLLKSRLGIDGAIFLPLFILFVCLIGTYLFYKYTIYLLVFLLSKTNFAQHHLNMLVLGNTRVHIQRGRKRLYAITIFLATALSMIGGATSFYTIGMRSVNVTDPVDFLVSENHFEQMNQIIQSEKQAKIETKVQLHYKLTGAKLQYRIGRAASQDFTNLVNILALSNYQEYQQINPYLKEITLNSEKNTVVLDSEQDLLSGLVDYQIPVNLAGGINLEVQAVQGDYLGQILMRYDAPTLIVSDQVFSQIKTGTDYMLVAFDLAAENEEKVVNKIINQIKPDWQMPIQYNYEWANNQVEGTIEKSSNNLEDGEKQIEDKRQEMWQLNYTSRFPDLRYQRRVMGLFIYVAMFLGVLAFIISGSILMLQQFSEAEKEKESYDLLKKIGVPKKQITRLVYQQNSMIFFPPMIIGSLHALFAILILSKVISSSGYWLAYFACGLLILIYLFYFFLTSAIYSRIVHRKDR